MHLIIEINNLSIIINKLLNIALGNMRILLILLFSVITTVVEARMYQWAEPEVGTTQLSGKPPAWYRSAAGGPRTFVFDKGRLIDDTAVKVSDDVRQRLRRQAFVLAEEDYQKAQEKMAKAQELKQKYKKAKPGKTRIDDTDKQDSDIEFVAEPLFPEENQAEDEEKDNPADKSLDELRAMIADWERQQTESAKQALLE